MEIADVFAINKSDLDGADRTKVEIEMNLDLNSKEDYRPPVVKVSAGKNKNLDKLLDELIKHRNYLEETNELLVRRKENTKIEILKLVEEELMDLIMHKSLEKNVLENLSEEVVHKNLDPYSAKDKVLNIIKE